MERDDQLTDEANDVLNAAHTEAKALGHPYLESEHLLLALIQDPGVAGNALRNLGVQYTTAQRVVAFVVDQGTPNTTDAALEVSSRVKRILELAAAGAQQRNARAIGTADLLLGIAARGEGLACGVLEIMGMTLAEVRQAVQVELGRAAGGATPTT